MRGDDPCTVLMHTQDAEVRGITDGETVRITGPGGSIDVPAEVCDDILPGVVAVPHGWGHAREGVQLRVAATRPGASVNDVTGALAMDPLSGNAVLQGVPVRIEALP
jgi:anaerobic selenocysteine-containing dehydrogenase